MEVDAKQPISTGELAIFMLPTSCIMNSEAFYSARKPHLILNR